MLEKAKIALHALLSGRFAAVPAQALTLKVLNLFLARHHMRTRNGELAFARDNIRKLVEAKRRLGNALLYSPGNSLPSNTTRAISRAFDTPSRNTLGPESAGALLFERPHVPLAVQEWMQRVASSRAVAPKGDDRMTFGRFDADSTANLYNSQMYRQARAFFADAAPQSSAGISPQCADCDWDQTAVNIGSAEIRLYFRAADPVFFDRNSVRLLADW